MQNLTNNIFINLRKYFHILIIIGVCFLFSSHLWHNDLLVHSDVARDFLVLDEMVQTGRPTLLGPRSGGIEGIFHGPAWYYINLLPFIIFDGNPIILGWFWWFLGLLAVLLFYFSLSYFNKNKLNTTIVSLIFAITLLPSAASAINTFIADLFSFFVFFIWLRWLMTYRMFFAYVGWFLLALLIQFQMAFSVPIIIIWSIIFLFIILKRQLYSQLPAVAMIMLPASTFILFEIRHNWLQIRSVLKHISSHGEYQLTFIDLLIQRCIFISYNFWTFLGLPKIITILLFAISSLHVIKNNYFLGKKAIFLAYTWLFSWWVVSFLFKGDLWVHHYSQFFGIFIFLIGLNINQIKYLKYGAMLSLIIISAGALNHVVYSKDRFDSSSWKLLKTIAKNSMSEENRGYFLYSQDQFAYQLKYAFIYNGKLNPKQKGYYFQKMPQTILVKSADNPNNPFSTAMDWQINKIRISSKPEETVLYPHGYSSELFYLDQEDIKLDVDTNLIKDLHFR